MTTHHSRRDVLILSGKAVLGLMAAFPALTGCGTAPASSNVPAPDAHLPPPTPLDWNSFIDQVAALAETQFAPGWDQEAYVHDVAGLMAALDLSDPQVEGFFSSYVNAASNFPEINAAHWQESFEVSILEFEPNEIIGLHDHPDMTGVIMCCSGNVEVENYTLLDERSDRGKYLLEYNASTVMTSGIIGTLTATNRNIHALRATEFTQMLDVFTPPYNDYRSQASRWFNKDEEGYQGSATIFEADAH